MRSYVQTTEPRKRMSSQRHEYLATRKNTFEAEEDLEESESHYWLHDEKTKLLRVNFQRMAEKWGIILANYNIYIIF